MLSLYVHIPFCVKKCPYCGFYSMPFSRDPAELFVAALERDAAKHRVAFSSRKFDTVYFGGGTPTMLPPDLMLKIISVLSDNFQIKKNAEFTVEANPQSGQEQTFEVLLRHGVNRISIGVQSFCDRILCNLGRPHTADQAKEALLLARRVGFSNISMDLIYGCSDQDEDVWAQTLDQGIEMRPEHISCYSLSLDEGTVYEQEAAAGRLRLPDDEAAADLYEISIDRLENAGYGHYEISNFSLPGFECRHNMNYWSRGAYLGLGPGAASFIDGRRFHAVPDLGKYCDGLESGHVSTIGEELVDAGDVKLETLMLALRTKSGLSLKQYKHDFGREELARLMLNAGNLIHLGMVEVAGDRFFLTRRGMVLANACTAKLAS